MSLSFRQHEAQSPPIPTPTVAQEMETVGSAHLVDHLAATLFWAYQFFTSSLKKRRKKPLIMPSTAAAAFYFSSFLSTSTAVYWRRPSQYTRIVCKASGSTTLSLFGGEHEIILCAFAV